MIKQKLKNMLNKHRAKSFKKHVVEGNTFLNTKVDSTMKKVCKKNLFSYSDYTIWNLKRNDYTKYIPTYWEYFPRFANSELMYPISDNKLISTYVYSKYFKMPRTFGFIQRKVIRGVDESWDLSLDNIFDYAKKHDLLFKPMGGQNGMSIHTIEYRNDQLIFDKEPSDKESIIQVIKKLNNTIIQEEAKQAEYASKIYPGSVNTIRVVSARKENAGEHEIICALHRFGNHITKTCDNFSQGGFAAMIDLETGEMAELRSGHPSYRDEDNAPKAFDKHPDTDAQVKGVKIPHWDKIKQAIIDFTRECPVFEFLAWDIFLNEKGEVSLIETNTKSSLNVFQIHGPMMNTRLAEVLKGFKKYEKV